MLKLLSILFSFSAGAIAQQTGLVETSDVDLAYESYGAPSAATPVIVANGGPGLSHVYMIQNDVWTRLAKTRQIVFYDQRGTGKSTRLKSGASQEIEAQIGDLEAVRIKFNFQKFDLVGDSYGGFLAMAYASAHPDRVNKLILSDSAAPAMKNIVRVLSQVFPDMMDRNPSRSPDPQEQMRNHFRMLFYSEEKRDAYLTGAKDLGYNPQIGAAVSRAVSNVDLTPHLANFAFPTLVITGRYDMNVAPLTAWNIYKAIPGAKFVVFAKSGHLPSYEEPDKYVQVVDAFLNGR
ncbi:MAG TPA: alpha/beta hydrolase [Bryobacteraceae bacterium]|nr:alpha/beta hydrolase [Bryobacteraceae bacterium]